MTAIASAKTNPKIIVICIFGADDGLRESAIIPACPITAITADGPAVLNIMSKIISAIYILFPFLRRRGGACPRPLLRSYAFILLGGR